jgi:hypothetical protein
MDSELSAWKRHTGRLVDVQLMAEVRQFVRVDRSREAKLLVLLAEVDVRKLYLAEGFSSLYRYAVSVLRMSEAQAFFRIRAARVARAYPVVLEMLMEGALNLSTIKLLAPHLTAENHVALLERARDKTKQDVERLVAEVAPQPDVPTRLRKLPAARAKAAQAELLTSAALNQSSAVAQETVDVTASRAAQGRDALESGAASAAVLSAVAAQAGPAAVTGRVASTFALEAPRASCTVLSPGRYKLEMTLNQELFDQLMKLKHLLKHQLPGGDLAAVVGRAIKELLDKLYKQRFAQVSRPRGAARAQASQNEAPAAKATGASAPQASVVEPRADKVNSSSRYIPRAVVRAVFARDGAQCTFVSANGQRCTEHGLLELHHVQAFARGGASTVENLKVVCAAHNAYFATQDFGAAHMRAMRARTRTNSISTSTRT